MALKIYGQKATVKFWEKLWHLQEIKKFFYQTNQSPLLPIFLKNLPKKGKILEAGCGLGQWVFTLSQKGFNIIGVDNAQKAILKSKKAFPKLKIKYADLLNLPFKKESFQATLCLGVLEHLKSYKKSSQALKEIQRTLVNGGLLFCSVPFYNPIRIIKNFFGQYPKKGHFYQYAFSINEFSQKLKNQDFKVIKVIPFDSYIGLKQELFPNLAPTLYKKLKPNYSKPAQKKKTKTLKEILFSSLKTILETYPSRPIFSHMLLFIAQKKNPRP